MSGEKLRAVLDEWAVPPDDMVSKLPKGGTTLDYMGHADVTRALIQVDPEWSWQPLVDGDGVPVIRHEGKRLVMWGHLTVLGKTLMCCGTCEDRKWEPEKELIGDLLRNGAMRFGIGLSLWTKSEWHDQPDAAPGPFDRVAERISRLDDDTRAAVREWCHANGITVTKAALSDEQADQVLAWLDRREAPFEDDK